MCGFLARIIVTYAYIFVSNRSRYPRRLSFNAIRMLPYPFTYVKAIASVVCLCPIIIHAESLDQ